MPKCLKLPKPKTTACNCVNEYNFAEQENLTNKANSMRTKWYRMHPKIGIFSFFFSPQYYCYCPQIDLVMSFIDHVIRSWVDRCHLQRKWGKIITKHWFFFFGVLGILLIDSFSNCFNKIVLHAIKTFSFITIMSLSLCVRCSIYHSLLLLHY